MIRDSKIMGFSTEPQMPSEISLPEHSFIGHRIAKQRCEPVDAVMYEYVLAGNGLMLRAEREEFTASLPLAYREIRNLTEIFVGIKWNRPRIRPVIWEEILSHARNSHAASEFKENVYLVYWDKFREDWSWRSAGKSNNWASTIADDTLPEYADACIELHTHPPGAFHFSKADDRDESGRFRIFGILADVHDKPKIRFRCGVYDNFVQIPASWVGVMPSGILDLNEIESLIKMML